MAADRIAIPVMPTTKNDMTTNHVDFSQNYFPNIDSFVQWKQTFLPYFLKRYRQRFWFADSLAYIFTMQLVVNPQQTEIKMEKRRNAQTILRNLFAKSDG